MAETMTLNELLAGGYEHGKIIKKILESNNSTEDKMNALIKIRNGVEIAPGTTVTIQVSPAIFFKSIMGEENDLSKITEKHVEIIANVCSDNRNDVRDHLKRLFGMSLAYSTTDGAGLNSTTNIDLFKDRVQKIRVLNAGFTNEQHAQIEDELVFAVVNNVMSADTAIKTLREVCPEIAEESLRRLQANVTGEFGMGGQSKSLAAAVVGTGSLNANPEQNTESTKYNTNPFIDSINANVQDVTNSVSNSFIKDGLSGSNTRANAISNSGNGAMADRRAAFMYQLVGVMSYYDVENFLNMLDKQFHSKNPTAQNDITNDHEQEIMQRTHNSMSSFNKDSNPDNVHVIVNPTTPDSLNKEQDTDTATAVDETPSVSPEQIRAVIRTIGVFMSAKEGGALEALTIIYNNPNVEIPAKKPNKKLDPHYDALYNRDERDAKDGPGNYTDDYRIAADCIEDLKKSGLNASKILELLRELDKDFDTKVDIVRSREREENEAQSGKDFLPGAYNNKKDDTNK